MARSGFDGRGCAFYFAVMSKRSFLVVSWAVALTAAVVVLAMPVAHAQAPQGGAGSSAPPAAADDAPQRPASPPASRTPRLSPQPADPTPPDLEAKGDGDKDTAAAAPPDTPTQRRRALDDLYAHLAATENAQTAVPVVAAIERLWLYSGSDTIDVLMERVLKAVAEQRLELAAKLSDAIVELEPGFAEGWNRRALVAYLQGDQENALDALTRALAIEPNHFKALDGIAQIMRERGDKAAALKAYRKLLEINPFWEGAQEAADQLTREVEGDGI